MRTRRILYSTLSTLCCFAALTAQAEPISRFHRATISPSVVYLQPGAQAKFKTVITATRLMAAQEPKETKWAVNDVPGGDATYGTIDENGLYHAPASIPSPREVHICAEVPEAANPFVWATVILGEGPPQYKQLNIWSELVPEGEKETEHLVDPHGIGLDKEGNILIVDQKGSAVHRFSYEGKYIEEIGNGLGTDPGNFKEPRIVVTDKSGNIWVSDSKGDRPRIQVFTHEGQFIRIFAEKGRPPGMILRCHGMGFDPEGNLYTTDVDNMRVNVYNDQGEFLYDWGEEGPHPGQFNASHGMFVDKNADVFVTGYYGPTQKFSAMGDYQFGFCPGDPPDGPIYFHNIAGDKWGNVYVMVRTKGGYQNAFMEKGSDRPLSIMKFNNNGDFITAWSFSSEDHRETSATVDNQGRVYALFVGSKEMGVEIFGEE